MVFSLIMEIENIHKSQELEDEEEDEEDEDEKVTLEGYGLVVFLNVINY